MEIMTLLSPLFKKKKIIFYCFCLMFRRENADILIIKNAQWRKSRFKLQISYLYEIFLAVKNILVLCFKQI